MPLFSAKPAFQAFLFIGLVSATSLLAQDTAKNKGLFNITQFSYIMVDQAVLSNTNQQSVDIVSSESHANSLNTIFGYFVVPKRLSIGVGFGLDGYKNPDFNTVPLYLDVRYYFSKKINSPYLIADYGLLLEIGENIVSGHGGLFGLGYKIHIGQKLVMIFDVGFSSKNLQLSENGSVRLRGAAFSLGIVFF